MPADLTRTDHMGHNRSPSATTAGYAGTGSGTDVRTAGTMQHTTEGRRGRAGSLVRPLVVAAAAAALVLGAVPAAAPAQAASTVDFLVNNAGDAGDARIDGVCATSTRVCTLRAAMQEANQHPAHAVIGFDLPAGSTIAVGSRLPAMLNPAGTTIDGYTQPGAAPNTAAHGSNAVLDVRVRGRGAAAFHGLVVQSPGNVVRGIAIYDFRIAIQITGPTVTGTVLTGNFICTDPAGTFGAAALNGGAAGVVINDAAHANTIGGPLLTDRNVISGCAHRGVIISYTGADDNVVQNNVVGLTPSGDAALPNLSHGLDVNYTAQDNLFIGNVVSGNVGNGIEISHGNANRRNDVVDNLVGTTVDGTGVAPWTANQTYGVRLEGNYPCDAPCPPNSGYSTVTGNVIVNNVGGGLFIDKGNSFNQVRDNRIGVLADGTPAGNPEFGVRIEYGSSGNVIGPGNEIAYNQRGVQMVATGSQPPSGGVTSVVRGNTLTRNSLHDNERLGIDLAPADQRSTSAGSVTTRCRTPSRRRRSRSPRPASWRAPRARGARSRSSGPTPPRSPAPRLPTTSAKDATTSAPPSRGPTAGGRSSRRASGRLQVGW